MIDNNVFRDISYGLYIVSTKYESKNVGCVINTLSQVTSENPIILLVLIKIILQMKQLKLLRNLQFLLF